MTDIVVLGSTNTALVARVEKPQQRGETVTAREFRTPHPRLRSTRGTPAGVGADLTYRSETETQHAS
ncbi:hypothetical protein [Streptomyces sp. IBSBF 2806]|uniref:hypothetical protein n=1 Tax=Streptomyces sp. IBSBF 2806 TaxID=2903529 RepID=UPI002FDBF2BB